MSKDAEERKFREDVMRELHTLSEIHILLERTNKLLEMICGQNGATQPEPTTEDIPPGLDEYLKAQENMRCIDHGDGCALCSDRTCLQRTQPYREHNKE